MSTTLESHLNPDTIIRFSEVLLEAYHGMSLQRAKHMMKHALQHRDQILKKFDDSLFQDMQNDMWNSLEAYDVFQQEFCKRGNPKTDRDFIKNRRYTTTPISTKEMMAFLRLGEVATIVETGNIAESETWLDAKLIVVNKQDQLEFILHNRKNEPPFAFFQFDETIHTECKWMIRPLTKIESKKIKTLHS